MRRSQTRKDARTPTEKPALSDGTKVPIGGWSFLSISIAIFAAYSAYILDGQLQEMHNNMLLDQRAWVGMIHHADIEFGEGSKGKFAEILRNSGKTPAFSLETSMFVEFVPQDSLLQFQVRLWKTRNDERGFRRPAGDGGRPAI